MNLFLLGTSPQAIAEAHADVHVVKMILEAAQMIYSAWWAVDPERMQAFQDPPAYRATHRNHPVSRWIRAYAQNYDFAVAVGMELCAEYERRYGREHKTLAHLRRLKALGYPGPKEGEDYEQIFGENRKLARRGLPCGITSYVCAIADEVFDQCAVFGEKGELDAIETYRSYYRTKVRTMPMVWGRGLKSPPTWWEVKAPHGGEGEGNTAEIGKTPAKRRKIAV